MATVPGASEERPHAQQRAPGHSQTTVVAPERPTPCSNHIRSQPSAPDMPRVRGQRPALSEPQGKRLPQMRTWEFQLSPPSSTSPKPTNPYAPALLSRGCPDTSTCASSRKPPRTPSLSLLFLAILPQWEKMTRPCHYSN